MKIQIQRVEIKSENITDQDRKLIAIQKKINEIAVDNAWTEITMVFKDGKMAYWCEKTTHQ